jgi:hypothetical protein
VDGDGINVQQGKTGAQLWVPFTPDLRAILATTPKRGQTIAAQPNGRPTSYRGAADLVMAVQKASAPRPMIYMVCATQRQPSWRRLAAATS